MKRLIVLRPEPGSSATVEAARKLGLDATAIPLFKVRPLPWHAPQGTGLDGLLLTSANALLHGGQQLQRLRGLKAYCVGEATALAAREAGFDIASTGDAGVDRLLASIEPGLRLLHLAGENHTRPADTKQKITTVPVYAAEELPAPERIQEVEGSVVALHSRRAAERLAALIDQKRLNRRTVAIAAISESVADAAGGAWLEIEAAKAPNEPSLLALASSMCKKPH